MSRFKAVSVSIASFLITSAASAVEVARCPATITVTLDGVKAASNAAIARELDARPQPDSVETELLNLRDLLAASDVAGQSELTFDLIRKDSSQCGYWMQGAAAPSDRSDQLNRETRLYTTNGTNVLRIALADLSPIEIANVFLVVTDYKTSGLTTKQAQKTRVLVDPSGADNRGVRYTIGTASNVSAK